MPPHDQARLDAWRRAIPRNCVASEKEQSAFLTLNDFREVFKSAAIQHTDKMHDLKQKLDGLISEETWECDDVFQHDYLNAAVVDCIVYYATGIVS